MDEVAPPSEGRETVPLEQPAEPSREGATRPLDLADAAPPPAWGRVAVDALAVASVAFLIVCALGALLLAGVKLRFPSLGRGADPVSVLTATILLGLAALRVPIEIGRVEMYALPLGAFAGVGAALAWAGRALRARVLALRSWVVGIVLGAAFGMLCSLAALLFRFADRHSPVHAQPLAALALGFVWATLFGTCGALLGKRRVVAFARDLWTRPLTRGHSLRGGARAAAVMVAVAAAGSALATLAWVAGSVIGDRGADVGVAGAVGVAVLLVAFAPNLMVLVLALGAGAAVEVGAKTSLGGALGGPARSFSLFEWPGPQGTPSFAYLLVLIPVAAGFAGGLSTTRRRAQGAPAAVALAVAMFAAAVTLWAWLGEARVAVTPGRPRGFGHLGSDLPVLFLASAAWTGLGAALGWWFGAKRARGVATGPSR